MQAQDHCCRPIRRSAAYAPIWNPTRYQPAASVRDGHADTLLEYSPDYADERAAAVVSNCARLGIELPAAELLDLMPEWGTLLD